MRCSHFLLYLTQVVSELQLEEAAVEFLRPALAVRSSSDTVVVWHLTVTRGCKEDAARKTRTLRKLLVRDTG